jgi:hypothetical protein
VCDVKVKLSHNIPLNLAATFCAVVVLFHSLPKACDCKISHDVIKKAKNLILFRSFFISFNDFITHQEGSEEEARSFETMPSCSVISRGAKESIKWQMGKKKGSLS